ncbi:RES family NAD+ phosphorylase [Xanthomonas campestris pv. campestris]|uniref:RES family NAD+ phosphorylase n=1 Tax=Xanthomonas campestris TaxID=339 RepID=UPI00160AD886|nr:RES family NAD+ phosphorylase [Xanthomonas campestris]MEB1196476.1 RES family NAD+ phosphorylase [Xanthomonas campestris pv. campestris]MEA9531940.1 RES family NAD+ phosphorylase [Xanthomonas campestris]MEB1267665.1 RES family NAD+ phosphorylase [Xanthomonas campestris pv. campestris]MEB1279701.1 RES family NAD+ phosphorylase [Xanthomonas campestris pv. campestris]MEB1342244.1 RES family NAD+ phosphorylase [Xanthomonas campestris pv. campestris]
MKTAIKDDERMVRCTECKGKRSGISIGDLGRKLEPLLRRYYVEGAEYPVFEHEDSEKPSWHQRGEDLDNIVQATLKHCYNCNEDIVDAVKDAEDTDPRSGEYGFWRDEANYQFRFVQYEPSWFPGWDETKAELMHGRRFFSPAAMKMFDALFKDIDNIKAWHRGKQRRVCYKLSVGKKLFRARVVDSRSAQLDVIAEPARHVGPPPAEIARSGRMNAEGVAVLYASTEASTCVAEMRPAIGSTLAVIELKTTQKLRLLDLSRLERAWGGLSLFDPNHEPKRIRLAALQQLHGLVSKPILPGKEAEYIVTQTMAEYLAHVCDKPFDGIRFRSAQDASGTNIVLFGLANPKDNDLSSRFGVEYTANTLEFVRINSVKVEMDSLSIVKFHGETYLLDSEGQAEMDQDY